MRYLSLKTTLIAAMISIALIPIVLLAFVSARSTRALVVAGALRDNQLLAQGLASEYEQVMALHLRAVVSLAADAGAQERFTPDALTVLIARDRASQPAFHGTLIMDPSGHVIAADPPTTGDGKSALGIDLSHRDWFKEMLATYRPVIARSVIMVGKVTAEPIVAVNAPIFRAGGRFAGAVTVGVGLRDLQTLADRIRLGESGHAQATTALGIVLVQREEDRMRAGTDFSTLPVWGRVSAAESGQISEYVDWAGDRRLAGFATVPLTGWKVWVTQSLAEVEGEVLATYGRLSGWILLSLVGAAVGVAFLAGAIARPIQALRLEAGAIAAGRLDQKVDEAGPREIRELARALNHMAVSLRAMIEAERTANRRKSEFLANMSHELRTPLNAIIGFTELIHDGKTGVVTPDQGEYLADVLTSARHLLLLINDVLDLAKVESGRMEFRAEPLNTEETVREVLEALGATAGGKRFAIETDIAPDLLTIVTDRMRLKQVLYQYVSNAVKFTPGEGRVTIRVRPEGTGRVRFEVEDSGIGIRGEDLERLFARFDQLDASAAKRYAGLGLGLALTKQIVEAQGGEVGVRSVPGQGSTFFAVLPCTEVSHVG